MKAFKKVIKVTALVIAAALVAGVGLCLPEAIAAAKGSSAAEAEEGVRYTDISMQNWISDKAYEVLYEIPLSQTVFEGADNPEYTEDGSLFLDKGDTLLLNCDGYSDFCVMLKYRPSGDTVGECRLNISADGGEYIGYLPFLWADATDDYSSDRNGSEYNPEQVNADGIICDYIYDYRDADKTRILFEGGSISVSPVSLGIIVSGIFLVRPAVLPDYSDYIKNGTAGTDFIIIEAEKYALKSDSFIRGDSESNPALEPHSPYKNLINHISQGSWKTAGQKIIWEFDVKNAGYYKLGFRYRQDANVNKRVFREIEIDGQVPFAQLSEAAFEYSGNSEYANCTLSDNDDEFYIYLGAGRHTVSMRAVNGEYSSVYNEIGQLMDEISELGISLKKLTAGSDDDNRTWDMDAYMPDAVSKIKGFADRIDDIYDKLYEIGGCEPVYAANLLYASETLRSLTEEPSHIPNRTELINSGDSSANKYLGTVMECLTSSALGLDRIYIYGDNRLLPSASNSFFTRAADTVKSFVYSFIADGSSDYSVSAAQSDDELKVWINRSIQYVQVLQRLVDSKYNRVNGTNIQLSVMPSEQKLILSNATGTNPDVVLGVASTTPFNLAIRNAAKNLLEYEDFLPFYNEQYNLEALIPMVCGDGVYGACETYDFQVLFYRKDILESLSLDVPDTWNDVKRMMPTLLRNSMNFFIPLSGSGGYKSYNMTTPFIYQNGGTVYSNDGVSTAIDTMMSANGFWDMTELYEIYSLDTVVASFYNSFRYGEIPIGISNFSMYIQLLIAAPELAQQWGIALTPGTVAEDGTVIRTQMADVNACMIFDNTKQPQQAWKFLKWWLSEETQTEYALTLQTTYGSEYRWNTANIKTFEQLPYDEEDKKVILEQLQSQMENIGHPANYMVEREISNIWNNTVIGSEDLIESIDESVVLINREIERKLNEFGYIDENGVIVKDYATNAYEFLTNQLEQQGEQVEK